MTIKRISSRFPNQLRSPRQPPSKTPPRSRFIRTFLSRITYSVTSRSKSFRVGFSITATRASSTASCSHYCSVRPFTTCLRIFTTKWEVTSGHCILWSTPCTFFSHLCARWLTIEQDSIHYWIQGKRKVKECRRTWAIYPRISLFRAVEYQKDWFSERTTRRCRRVSRVLAGWIAWRVFEVYAFFFEVLSVYSVVQGNVDSALAEMQEKKSPSNENGDSEWLEVGHKNRTMITRTVCGFFCVFLLAYSSRWNKKSPPSHGCLEDGYGLYSSVPALKIAQRQNHSRLSH